MRYLLTILTLFFSATLFAQTPTANAGADQTIYLTTTSTATLTGSGTGTGLTYLWTEVSTDYSSGATITSPTSATTTVTNLPQGVFYFELQVTDNVDRVAVDTVAVIVDYAPPPTGTLVTHAIWSDMAYGANLRNDTTTCFSWTSDIRSLVGTSPNDYIMEKDGTLGSWIDSMRQKYYSVILDGHGCSGYGRSEIIPARHLEDWVDTSKIYVIEWKGYFPQDMSPYAVTDYANVIGQIHGSDGYSPPFGIAIKNNQLYFTETFENGNGTGNAIYNPSVNLYAPIMSAASLWNQTHTFRWVFKEGKNYPNQKNFIELKIDGVTKYYRNTGQIGSTMDSDWIKGATMYDFDNLITDANNTTRGRKVSLATTSYKVYTVADTSTNVPPTANAGTDQTITLPTSTVTLSGSGTDTDGTISSYSWSKVSGSGTITSPSSASTTITGLTSTSVFRLTVTDNQGATGTDDVQVTVNPAAGMNNWILRSGGQLIMINQ